MDRALSMDRALLNVLASAGGFLSGYAVPSLLVMVMGHASRARAPDESPPSFDDYAMMLYLVGIYALAATVLFSAITATSRKWRERPARQVAVISAIAGGAGQILNWTGLSLFIMVPLLKIVPRSAAAVIGIGVSGVIVALAVLLWSSTRRQPERPSL
jgi:hypothetical protein